MKHEWKLIFGECANIRDDIIKRSLEREDNCNIKSNVKQGKISDVPRQPKNADSFLKEGHNISPSAVLRRKWQ